MKNTLFRIDDPYSFLTKELLEIEYISNRLTDKQIAIKYGIGSKATVWRRRKFYNIGNSYLNKSNSNASKNRVFEFSLEDAKKWRESGMTYPQIALMTGCSRTVVCRRYKELGLVREIPQAQNKLKWHTELTANQKRFLLGTLLGDGNITSIGMFQCNHSSKQLEYIKWKAEIISSLLSPLFELKPHMADDGTGKEHEAYYLRTMQNKYLMEIYDVFYQNGIKIFPYSKLLESVFDEFSLAVWYMDDGCFHSNKYATIGTYGFGKKGNKEILGFLLGKFSILGQLNEDQRKSEDKRNWVFIGNDDSQKFFSLIAPYIHPSMAYKLPESFRQRAGSLLPQNNLAR